MNPVKFTASTSWADAMSGLSKDQRCEIYDAIFYYAANKTIPKMSTEIAIAFSFIKIDLDINFAAAERKRASLRANASKGGQRTASKKNNK